jgi:tetratricopeptide (TPR) repeat protein
MGNDKDIESSNTESVPLDTKNSGFFTKYSPYVGEEPGTNARGFFNKYLPPREGTPIVTQEKSESTEHDSQASPVDPELHHRSKAVRRALNFVWPLLLVAMVLGIMLAEHSRDAGRGRATTDNPSQPPDPDLKTTPEADSRVELDPPVLSHSKPFYTAGLSKVATTSPSHQGGFSSASPMPGTMLRRAREFEDRGMLEQAEQEYSAILERVPGDRPSILGLSRVQSILSKQRTSDVARQNRETGLKKFRWGDYAAAAMSLSAAVDAGRTDTATLYSLGMSYLKLGRPSEARTVFDRCVAARPDYAPALVGLAEVEKDRGSKDQALLLLKRALELGGGAEFSPVRIMEMISALAPVTKSITNEPQQLTVTAVHRHGFPFSQCRGQLIIDGSVIRFSSDNPSHSFSVPRTAVAGARASGSQLTVDVNGKPYTLRLKGGSALDFLNALTH